MIIYVNEAIIAGRRYLCRHRRRRMCSRQLQQLLSIATIRELEIQCHGDTQCVVAIRSNQF